MSSLKEVTTVTDLSLEVNTSIEVCKRFGFKPDQKVRSFNGLICTVVGVGPLPIDAGCIEKGTDVLWLSLESRNDEKVCFFPDPADDLTLI